MTPIRTILAVAAAAAFVAGMSPDAAEAAKK